jgi:GntR family histidine utilization transcriptional repressor
MTETKLSWRDVRDTIHQSILSGAYRPGDKLPRDADFAQTLNCARSTVQRAMQDLSDSGLIERRRKGGTRVRANPIERFTLDIPIARQEVEQRGCVYGYHLIDRDVQTPPFSVTAALGLKQAQDMLHVTAMHLADARPYILEDRWISLDTVPEILDVDLSKISANEWLIRNKPYDSLSLRIYAENAGSQTANLLGITENAAMLVMERTTWITRAPVTCVKAYSTPGYQFLSRS